MKKILVLIMLMMGMNVILHAEVMTANAQVDNRNDYVYDNTYGYAVPVGDYCKKYIDIIKAKDAQIKILSEEVASLRAEQQLQLQKYLKKKHDKEMQKFDQKRSSSSVKKTNSIIISDKPTQ